MSRSPLQARLIRTGRLICSWTSVESQGWNTDLDRVRAVYIHQINDSHCMLPPRGPSAARGHVAVDLLDQMVGADLVAAPWDTAGAKIQRNLDATGSLSEEGSARICQCCASRQRASKFCRACHLGRERVPARWRVGDERWACAASGNGWCRRMCSVAAAVA